MDDNFAWIKINKNSKCVSLIRVQSCANMSAKYSGYSRNGGVHIQKTILKCRMAGFPIESLL